MSRSAFAARFKELLGQTPLEYVTEWRMQKAMRLLQQRDKKLLDVARSVGYESDAAFSKRSSELSGPTLVNTSNVVLKTGVMPDRGRFMNRRILLEPTMAPVAYRRSKSDIRAKHLSRWADCPISGSGWPTRTLHPFWGNFRVAGNSTGIRRFGVPRVSGCVDSRTILANELLG
jgi:AraC-like DNA-binding protein